MLCESLGMRPAAPTLVFALVHPSWRIATATAQPEALAMAGVLAAAVACQRSRDARGIVLLAASTLIRFPSSLIAPALAWKMLRTDGWKPACAMMLSPVIALTAWNAFVVWRVPGVHGVSEAHRIWLEPALGFPFFGFARESVLAYSYAFVVAAISLAGLLIAVRRIREGDWIGLWFATIVLFHASMTSSNQIWRAVLVADYPRLTLLAWPALILVVARNAPAASMRATVLCAIVLGGFAQWFAVDRLITLSHVQPAMTPSLNRAIELRESDQPSWPYRRNDVP